MTPVILETAKSVIGIYLVGLLGFYLGKSGFIPPENRKIFPKLVTSVALPPYLFVEVTRSFSKEELLSLIGGTLVPIISILAVFGLALLYVKIFAPSPRRRGLISVGSATSNTIFIGLPVNIALFGHEAIVYVLLYFFANTTFFWTIGNYALSLDGAKAPGQFSKNAALQAILSPPFIGFLLGLAFVTLNISPPQFVEDSLSLVGGLTTPLALLFIGLSLVGATLASLKPNTDLWVTLAGRFVISPLLVFLLTRYLIPAPPLMTKVFIIQSSLPAAANLALMSAYHGSDATFASLVVSFSTLLSLVTIPLYMVLFSLLGV
ncbi:MAG: AEC family transporter [Deltaproteobacteria bacterium]|jgi:predicted permease|nr:AEC family transporter [Deltaproteobacteria bacterium]